MTVSTPTDASASSRPAIRTVLFDLGNVLVNFSHERMWRQLAAVCGRDVSELRELIRRHDLGDAYERGRLSEGGFHAALQRLTGAQFELAEMRSAFGDIFELNPAMPAILQALKARGHRLVLLSNTNETHLAWVRERFAVLEFFDELVLSFRVGAMKPQGEIYEAALAAIDCRPEECFYTDDIPKNVEAGRAYGLQAEVFTDAENLWQQLRRLGCV